MKESSSLDFVKRQLLSFLDHSKEQSEEEAFYAASLYVAFIQRLSPEETRNLRAILQGPEAKILEVLARQLPEQAPEEAETGLAYHRATGCDPTIGVWLGENGPEPAR